MTKAAGVYPRRRSVTLGMLALGLMLGTTAVGERAFAAGKNHYPVTTAGAKLMVSGKPFKIKGVRLSNALISDKATSQLVDRGLDIYQSYGVNTISVYVMGSRFGDVKGYNADTTLNPVYMKRLARIIEAAEQRGMVVLVGCLYWGGSQAKENLGHWTQAEANQAVFNTVKWLKDNNYTNVFVDPDNEGMAYRAKGFKHADLIDAGHAANPAVVMAYNSLEMAPPNADILIHFSPAYSSEPKPYVETEGTPLTYMTGIMYWGEYSRGAISSIEGAEGGKYVNIGVYTPEMIAAQKLRTTWGINNEAGYMLASTWIQAQDANLDDPGGMGTKEDPGVRWWLEYIRDHHRGD